MRPQKVCVTKIKNDKQEMRGNTCVVLDDEKGMIVMTVRLPPRIMVQELRAVWRVQEAPRLHQ